MILRLSRSVNGSDVIVRILLSTIVTVAFKPTSSSSFWSNKLDLTDDIVCQSKYFRAKCSGSDEIVVVRRARYGRMNLSRCVKENFGYIGCSNDVLDVLDGHCSGRHSCSLRVLDENFMNMKPCHEDLKSYLAVQYNCVKVITSKKSSCLGDRPIVVSQPAGVLASIVSAETGCGTTGAPWRLQVLPGQRINVTLVDFSWATAVGSGLLTTSAIQQQQRGLSAAIASAPSEVVDGSAVKASSSPGSPLPVDCRVYAIIKDAVDAVGTTVCGGETRLKTVYVSKSNRIEIQMINVGSTASSGSISVAAAAVHHHQQQHQHHQIKHNYAFALVYEAIGCPDIEAPPGGWIQRTDRSLMAGCSRSTETWQLHCSRDLHWVGEMRNCSPAKLENVESEEEDLMYSTLMFPSGLLVIIVLAMALFVGLFILVVGVLCLTRLHGRQRGRDRFNDESKRIIYAPALAPSSSPAAGTAVAAGVRRSWFKPAGSSGLDVGIGNSIYGTTEGRNVGACALSSTADYGTSPRRLHQDRETVDAVAAADYETHRLQSYLRPRAATVGASTVGQTSPVDDDPTVTLLVRQQQPDSCQRNAHMYQRYGYCGHRPFQRRTSADDSAADVKNAPPSYAVIFSPSAESRTSLPNSPAPVSATSSPRRFFVAAAPVLSDHEDSSMEASCAGCHTRSSNTAMLMTSSSAPETDYCLQQQQQQSQQHQIYYLPTSSVKAIRKTITHQSPASVAFYRPSTRSPADDGNSENTSGLPASVIPADQLRHGSRATDQDVELVPVIESIIGDDERRLQVEKFAMDEHFDLIGNMTTGSRKGNEKRRDRVAVVELASLAATRQEMINAL